MESNYTNDLGTMTNMISLLNVLDKISVTEERLKNNIKAGRCNDGIVIVY